MQPSPNTVGSNQYLFHHPPPPTSSSRRISSIPVSPASYHPLTSPHIFLPNSNPESVQSAPNKLPHCLVPRTRIPQRFYERLNSCFSGIFAPPFHHFIFTQSSLIKNDFICIAELTLRTDSDSPPSIKRHISPFPSTTPSAHSPFKKGRNKMTPPIFAWR